jgi:DNA repair photolyase
MAAESPQLRSKRTVEYFSLRGNSILNRCSSPGMPFLWTINPYRGCEFGCKYCYARYTHEFMGMENPLAFEEKIYSKRDAGEILRAELCKNPGGAIAIGTATDPYQPAERLFETTRSILQALAEFRGLEISITTKSDLVVRDLPLLREIARCNALEVHITITTLREDLARQLEPLAPRPDLRLRAVKALADSQIAVGVNAMPVLPGVTDSPQELDAVARAASQVGASHFAVSVLFLKPAAQRAFFPFLEQHFPHLVERYRRLYSRGAYLHGKTAQRIQQTARDLRTKYGLEGISPDCPPQPFGRRDQLALF